jgi:N-methylhydantoinase A/oxoprolinase/acetone carboxylase beta subunit
MKMPGGKKPSYSIFVDNGGTFTDAVIVHESGDFWRGKSDTTPENLHECFFAAIQDAAGQMGESIEDLLYDCRVIGYGTTLGTNILVSGGTGGTKLGFITTKGHEDRTIIGRLRTAGLNPVEAIHRVAAEPPTPIVPRPLIKGVTERIDFFGDIVIPLDESEVRRAVKDLLNEGVEGIAIGLLWSFINPVHEQRIKTIIQEILPHMACSLSSEVAPTVREYTRFMSTIIDLYIGRPLEKLLREIGIGLKKGGYAYPLLVMQASGGLSRADVVKPGTTLHSGPVGGLAGVEFFKNIYGYKEAMGSDMGGTSFDVVYSPPEGKRYLREPIVKRYEIATPMCQLFTIGAGGGSIAWVDKVTKTLHVGPRSAESVPGPICYGLGGTEATVTDADVVLNRIPSDYFMGGLRKLKREEALSTISKKIGEPLGMDAYHAAETICKIIDGTMEAEMKRVIARQGIDSSKCLLFAYGGAGPAHCAYYSAGLGFPKVIIPPMASTFCAFGASTTDILHRYVVSCFSWFSDLPYDPITLRFNLDRMNLGQIPSGIIERFNTTLQTLEQKADADMKAEGFEKQVVAKKYEMEARYGGQLWEIACPIPIGQLNSAEDLRTLIRCFEDEYVKTYSKEAMVPRGGMEIVSVALTASVSTPKRVRANDYMGRDSSPALKGEREVYFEGGWVKTRIYQLNKLQVGNIVDGHAIIEGRDTTVVVPYEYRVSVDEYLNLVMERR